MKSILFILVILSLFFCYCTSSQVFDVWENGAVKETKTFKNKKLYNIIFYNTYGIKEEVVYYNYKNQLPIKSNFYNDSGIIIKNILFVKFDYDTVLVENNPIKLKVVSTASFFQNEYYPNGKIKTNGYFNKNKKDSIFTYYNLKGEKELVEYYRMDSLLKSIKY